MNWTIVFLHSQWDKYIEYSLIDAVSSHPWGCLPTVKEETSQYIWQKQINNYKYSLLIMCNWMEPVSQHLPWSKC